ncbi:hypothetical protein FS837_005042 [Tulasnella sp. UAMH 9824]|nr:hypothetical protein FS837_005042 [Tulasnella sp. UAMH 9824]
MAKTLQLTTSSDMTSLVPGSPDLNPSKRRDTIVHPDFNFDDANVVLAVTGPPIVQSPEHGIDLTEIEGVDMELRPETPASVTTLFKVHLFQLSRHSDVLLSVLGRSQTAGATSLTMGGLPNIQLNDDPLDVLNLLNLIYNSDILPTMPFRQETFNIMSSVLRLTPKYNLTRLGPIAKRQIQEEWPREIEEWDRNEKQLSALCEWNALVRQADDVEEYPGEEVNIVEPCTAIRFGTDCGMPDILPAAFYHLSRLSPIYDRVHRSPNDLAGYQRSQSYWLDGGRSANRTLLSSQDFERLYIGKGEIREWIEDFVDSGWKSELLLGCAGADLGCAAMSDGWAIYWSSKIEPMVVQLLCEDGMDVLEWLRRAQDCVGEDAQLCNECCSQLREAIGMARKVFWMSLPKFFGLERPKFWGGLWKEEAANHETDASGPW